MQGVLIEKPYRFVPPVRMAWPARLFAWSGWFRRTLRRQHGVEGHECRNLDRLRASLKAGHGVMLCANHARMADAVVLGHVARETPCPFFIMASWHLFNQGWASRFLLRMLGGFSVNREGLDRQAVDEAVSILAEARRPLLIFPEGTTSRTNDQLMALMEGPAFIARTAAKRRAKNASGQVVVHPVAIKYLFSGDIERVGDDVLSDIESRLTWRPARGMALIDRLVRVGNGLLRLKELERGIDPPAGATLRERQTAMVNCLLDPLEAEWLGGPRRDGIAVRVKNLRMKIFPEMSRDELPVVERDRRWAQLQNSYLAQQIDCYPEQYVTRFPSVDRILETLEKFEEDLTDAARVHGQLKAVIDIGEAIEVSPERERKSPGGDPLMNDIRSRLESMLAALQGESRMYVGTTVEPGTATR